MPISSPCSRTGRTHAYLHCHLALGRVAEGSSYPGQLADAGRKADDSIPAHTPMPADWPMIAFPAVWLKHALALEPLGCHDCVSDSGRLAEARFGSGPGWVPRLRDQFFLLDIYGHIYIDAANLSERMPLKFEFAIAVYIAARFSGHGGRRDVGNPSRAPRLAQRGLPFALMCRRRGSSGATSPTDRVDLGHTSSTDRANVVQDPGTASIRRLACQAAR